MGTGRTETRITAETEHVLEARDERRLAADRLRATARVAVVLDELARTGRTSDPRCYASAAIDALDRV